MRPSRSAPDHLAVGLRQALEAAQPGEVELTQGLDAEGDVPHDSADERATGPATDLTLCLGQETGRREVLLDSHEQHERRLTVGHGPVCGSDGRDGRAHPRQAHAHDLVGGTRRITLCTVTPSTTEVLWWCLAETWMRSSS